MMTMTIRILLLEDLPADAEMAKRELKKAGIEFVDKVVETEEAFKKELNSFQPDIIISDYLLPSFDGMRALKIVRKHTHYIPFIILTGSMNEETAVSCMKAGANDYVIKEQIKRLPYAVLEAIEANKTRLEKLKVEQQLKLLSRALEQNPVSIVISDYQGTIEYVNPAFTEITGYTLDEIKDNHPRILSSKHQSDRFYKQIWKTIRTGEEWQGEIRDRKKNGSLYWEMVIISPIVDEKGDITHFIMVREDITEKKRMVEELIEAKEKAEVSDRLKTAFLANMSHEIRTPMNGILGFTDLLSNPQLSGEEKSQYIGIIQKSGHRMLNTVNDIIEISKIETGQVKPSIFPVNICQVIEDLVGFFDKEAEQKGLGFNYDKRTDPGTILTDLTKFSSIISNLIKNAIKYTDKGSVTVGCEKDKDQTIIYVRDTGIGIPADRQKAVFNRFEQADISDTRAFQGSGLGLSIAKSYVEMLGGEIWLESEEGKGSQFSFTIPSHDNIKKTDNIKQQIIKMNKTKNSKLKILIAEDEEAATMFLSIILQERAAEFFYATTGTEAVELCKKNPDIDVVLMDIKMPEMDGYVATQKIRKFNKDVVIIAQTAYAITGDREKALEAGCSGYIAKPIDEDEMLELIDELV